jgi:hypothetical protein
LTPGFVSEPLVPGDALVDGGAFARGEPPLPRSFTWRGETLAVRAVTRAWRSTNLDRGDTYLARHWYALALADGREAVVYFDRKAKRRRPRWWLYSLASATAAGAAPAPERDVYPG